MELEERLKYEEVISELKEKLSDKNAELDEKDAQIKLKNDAIKIKDGQIDSIRKTLLRQNLQLRHKDFTNNTVGLAGRSQIDNETVDAIWEEHNKGFLGEFSESVDGNIAKD